MLDTAPRQPHPDRGARDDAFGSAPVRAGREAPEAPLMRAIRDHVEANLGDAALTPDAIARRFGLSRASLYRLWRPLGGVAGHVRERRLARARLHLCAAGGRRASIAEIAHRCGFGGEASFSRAYRRRFGCTPSDTVAEALGREPGVDTRPPAEGHAGTERDRAGGGARSRPGGRAGAPPGDA